MKRKDYQIPTTRVVEMHNHSPLLTGSPDPMKALRGGYGTAIEVEW